MKYTIHQFNQKFPTENACLDFVFRQRTQELTHCPKCGTEFCYYRVRNRKCYECKDCANQIHPLAHTIFHKSETPLRSWFFAIYLFSVAKNGVAAKELQRHLGVTYKTALRIGRKIRELMEQSGDRLSGIIEADETYIGGKHRREGMYDNKTAVVGIVEKKKGKGQAKAFTTKHGDATVALPFLRANIMPGSMLHTDDSRIYSRVKRDFDHEFVNHSKEEYYRAGVHTNTIEGFWSQLKRSIDGTYHSVSPKYLQTYVNEFVYRYNLRDVPVYPILLQQAVPPLKEESRKLPLR